LAVILLQAIVPPGRRPLILFRHSRFAKSMKILLIEDNSDTRRNLRQLIEKRGHEVTACANVEKAEEELTRNSFPFLILDWMLPGKSGLDLCRDIRSRPDGDEMFILLVTGRTNTEDLEQALSAGANDYLTKPLSAAHLDVRLSVAERQIQELQERNRGRIALLEAAERMSDILENTSDGFFALDRNGNFTYLNAEAEKTFGLTRDQLFGQNFAEKVPQLAERLFAENYQQVVTRQIAAKFETISLDGHTWYEFQIHPSADGASIFFRDITERRRIEAEHLTTCKLESLGTLAGGIAHDLNNVLTVISGNIGLAQLESPAHCGNLLSFLAKAGQAAQQAARLSSQLLTFSKGGAPFKKVASLAELLQRATEFSLHGSNLRSALEIEDHLGRVEMDTAQVEQVINALILNAREAMPNGGAVAISAENFRIDGQSTLPLAAGRYLKISIADNGPGVAREVAAKVFDPYFTTKQTGSGLGLAISYSIIKKHGGFLHLENNSPEGATFTFYLPAIHGRVTSDPFQPNDDKIDLQQPRVLVMDDEAPIRELTAQLLETMGYEVTAAPDGSEAIRLYERALRQGNVFKAVILDATVRGGLGGVETIARLRELDPDVKAIICSGYSDAAAISEFLTCGFRDALPKPFTRRELAEALARTTSTGLTKAAPLETVAAVTPATRSLGPQPRGSFFSSSTKAVAPPGS
jgi:two-component system, cell cycle sensor histidine kinase and response regulator CckA